MQKAFSLQQNEMQQASQLDEERRNLLADYGAIELNRERIRNRLPQVEQAQRELVQRAVERVGVERYTTARFDRTNLVVELPDEPQLPAPPPSGDAESHPNGAVKQ
jgi:hypothetical protein